MLPDKAFKLPGLSKQIRELFYLPIIALDLQNKTNFHEKKMWSHLSLTSWNVHVLKDRLVSIRLGLDELPWYHHICNLGQDWLLAHFKTISALAC